MTRLIHCTQYVERMAFDRYGLNGGKSQQTKMMDLTIQELGVGLPKGEVLIMSGWFRTSSQTVQKLLLIWERRAPPLMIKTALVNQRKPN